MLLFALIALTACQSATWFVMASYSTSGCTTADLTWVQLYPVDADNDVACITDDTGFVYISDLAFDTCTGTCPGSCTPAGYNGSTECDIYLSTYRYFWADTFELDDGQEVYKFVFYGELDCAGDAIGLIAYPTTGCLDLGCFTYSGTYFAESYDYKCQTGGELSGAGLIEISLLVLSVVAALF